MSLVFNAGREMNNVVDGHFITSLDVPVKKVLNAAAVLQSVVVLGYTSDGQEFFSSSIADGSEVLWLIERLKLQLLNEG